MTVDPELVLAHIQDALDPTGRQSWAQTNGGKPDLKSKEGETKELTPEQARDQIHRASTAPGWSRADPSLVTAATGTKPVPSTVSPDLPSADESTAFAGASRSGSGSTIGPPKRPIAELPVARDVCDRRCTVPFSAWGSNGENEVQIAALHFIAGSLFHYELKDPSGNVLATGSSGVWAGFSSWFFPSSLHFNLGNNPRSGSYSLTIIPPGGEPVQARKGLEHLWGVYVSVYAPGN